MNLKTMKGSDHMHTPIEESIRIPAYACDLPYYNIHNNNKNVREHVEAIVRLPTYSKPVICHSICIIINNNNNNKIIK